MYYIHVREQAANNDTIVARERKLTQEQAYRRVSQHAEEHPCMHIRTLLS